VCVLSCFSVNLAMVLELWLWSVETEQLLVKCNVKEGVKAIKYTQLCSAVHVSLLSGWFCLVPFPLSSCSILSFALVFFPNSFFIY